MKYTCTRLSRVSKSAELVATVALTATVLPLHAEPPAKTADELAKELTNPNNDVAKLTFKNQYRTYKGDLPNADQQDNYTLLFQPVFPFSLGTNEAGDKIVFFLGPAIPFVVDQPYFNAKSGDFKNTTDMGDWSFDSALGITRKDGWIYAGEVVGTLPFGTSDEVTGAQLCLGPELLVGKFSKWGLLAIFPNHQWDVTGRRGTKEKRDADYSTTTTQLFAGSHRRRRREVHN